MRFEEKKNHPTNSKGNGSKNTEKPQPPKLDIVKEIFSSDGKNKKK